MTRHAQPAKPCSLHDLRGLRRAARKRAHRATKKSAAIGPAYELTREHQAEARATHYEAARLRLRYSRLDAELADRLSLPVVPMTTPSKEPK